MTRVEPNCNGRWEVGSACARCERCLSTAADALAEIRRSHAEVVRLKRVARGLVGRIADQSEMRAKRAERGVG